MKEFFDVVVSILLLLALLAFVVWAAVKFVDATGDLLVSIEERNNAKEYCYEKGYLGVTWVRDRYFCYNSEKVVPIE